MLPEPNGGYDTGSSSRMMSFHGTSLPRYVSLEKHTHILTVPQDPYFPHGVVDLRYAISCEPSGERDIRIRTNQKTIKLSADSVPSRDEWVKAIRKVMFKAQNMGDSVKVRVHGKYRRDRDAQ